ncbi:MAG: hypothetical protein R3C05_22845 [Pirellulaceae bacterium]
MRKVLLTVLLVTGVLMSGAVQSQAPRELGSANLRDVMKQKLEHSRALLEGVVLEDFDKVTKHGQALSLLSLESGWQVLQTDEYVELSKSFRETADRLTRAGREKNLDAATLAYMDMTMRCVQCHRYVRSHSNAVQLRK